MLLLITFIFIVIVAIIFILYKISKIDDDIKKMFDSKYTVPLYDGNIRDNSQEFV